MTSRRRTASLARERLRELSRAAYTAAAGHLDVEPDASLQEPPRDRWSLAPRLAVSAVVAVLALAGAVGARALSIGGSAAPVPVTTTVDGWAPAEEALGGARAGVGEAGDAAPQPSAGDGNHDLGFIPPPDGVTPQGRPGEQPVVVHVAGHVAAPGVVELPQGSRVHDALDAAGGPTAAADLAAVNLARPAVDGEQIYVPAPGESPPATAPAHGDEPSVVDLNTATADQLDALPGIGPVLAGRIVDWRTEHGRFTVVEELGEVAGIGPTLLERLRDRVRV